MSITHFKSHIAAKAGISGAGAARTQTWEAPAAAATAAIHAAITLPETGTLEVTEDITNPDLPRVVSITGGKTGTTGNVIIDGTDIEDNVIQGTIAANGTDTVDGVKAFKTVTKITVPVQSEAGDTIAIGISAKLGLDKLLPNFSDNGIDAVLMAATDGVYETERPTVVAHITDVSQNVILFKTASAPDGSKDFVVMFLSDQTN